MIIYMLDKNFDVFEITDMYSSFIWTDRYTEAGDFEIVIPASTVELILWRQCAYIQIDPSDRTMMVEDIRVDEDPENGDTITITGRSLEAVLARRIVWGQKNYSKKKVSEIVEDLLKTSIINPTESKRKIDNFVYVSPADERVTALTNTLESVQYQGDDIYSAVVDLCQKYYIGFSIILTSEKKIQFSFYVGSDKSDHVIFSPSFENIVNTSMSQSKREFATVAYIEGEGSGTNKVNVTYARDADAVGLDRYEVHLSASDISLTTDDPSSMTAEKYKDLLTSRAKTELSKHKYNDGLEVDGELDGYGMGVYRQDYYVGDTVQVESKYGDSWPTRIKEMIFSSDENGEIYYPSFEMDSDDNV